MSPAAIQAVRDFLLGDVAKPPCEQSNDLVAANKQDRWGFKWNNPLSFTLGSSIRQSCVTAEYMLLGSVGRNQEQLNQHDVGIPLDLLSAAEGLCFMTVFKAGLVVSGRVGTGLVIRRLSQQQQQMAAAQQQQRQLQEAGNNHASTCHYGWSAPCAVGTVGMGWGAQLGGEVTHYLIVLTTQKAVQDLVGSSSVQLGAELGVAVGPVGRAGTSHLQTGDWTLHQAYAYAHSQGLFVGMSLEGSVVAVRNDVNAKFYGVGAPQPAELLQLPGPKAAEPLYRLLDQATQVQIPEGSFRPSQLINNNN